MGDEEEIPVSGRKGVCEDGFSPVFELSEELLNSL